MVPQTHPLGYEAEVDFGSVRFLLRGELTTAWMHVMRLSASGKSSHRVYAMCLWVSTPPMTWVVEFAMLMSAPR